MTLTIVGLGPGAPGLLTVQASEVIRGADPLYLRTEKHPVVEHLPGGLNIVSFDEAYIRAETFEGVYEEIADALRAAAEDRDIVYAVPGDPSIGETTVVLLRRAGLEVRVIPGVSFVEPACRLIELDPVESGLQLADALDLKNLEPSRPALVAQVFSRWAASEVKLAALKRYPEDARVGILHDLSLLSERVRWTTLAELDRSDDFDHLTSVFLPALAPERNVKTIEGLRAIVTRLHGPDGCPWDREQTHQSLRKDLLEETYEVLEALDAGEPGHLAEELGDLLNQVVFHAQIAAEAGDFELEEVIEAIASKLVRRHPHVFGEVEVSGTADVLRNWENIKREEKGGEGPNSTLDRVPKTLPALHQASGVLERAGRDGFKWPTVEDIFAKVVEELEEMQRAATPEEREEELGDLLFNLVNAGRYMGIDSESALRRAIEKFRTRFAIVEAKARERSLSLGDLDREGLMALWEEAKRAGEEAR